jgi:hypothetical protein
MPLFTLLLDMLDTERVRTDTPSPFPIQARSRQENVALMPGVGNIKARIGGRTNLVSRKLGAGQDE